MLKNNLKLAFRNILANKLYSAINIVGLGVASAFCILVYLYVKNEQSFDRFHHDQDQLFREEQTKTPDPAIDKKPSGSIFSFLMKNEGRGGGGAAAAGGAGGGRRGGAGGE